MVRGSRLLLRRALLDEIGFAPVIGQGAEEGDAEVDVVEVGSDEVAVVELDVVEVGSLDVVVVEAGLVVDVVEPESLAGVLVELVVEVGPLEVVDVDAGEELEVVVVATEGVVVEVDEVEVVEDDDVVRGPAA